MRSDRVRSRLLDLYIIILSVLCLLAGVAMILYCLIALEIKIYKPYVLYGILVWLGILGIRYYRKEVEL